ncbi:hypothetical protein [Hymenobacter edaphi]|uniref:DUF7868 domain-containing protein n=1 Tax=Hymenobacter edaphi TaxID=2211146 RepID=A0A328BC62_9BACT|nr:hypothetical protein [Hymenobacter edaphi]RAK64587.1 hypothetical protein DLM85_18015 [Hymenobacter edaphi]
MDLPQNAEQLGVSAEQLPVVGAGLRTSVRLTPAGRRYLAAAAGHAAPAQLYLTLENVHGTRDATVLNVYLVFSEAGEAGGERQLPAGSAALYGLRRASNPQGSNRAGLTLTFDITPLLAELRASPGLQNDGIRVSIIPDRPLPATSDIVIGRVSIFRML